MRFGSSDEAKRCAKALLYALDIRSRFPDKVREEAKKLEDVYKRQPLSGQVRNAEGGNALGKLYAWRAGKV